MVKKPRYFGLMFELSDSHSIGFHFNPTSNGISFGPVIKGYDIHVTAFERNGIFHSHLTYSEKGWKKPKYEPIVTMSYNEVIEILKRELVRWLSAFCERYDENGEALVITDEGWKILRKLLRDTVVVGIKGRKLLFNVKLNRLIHLIDKENVLKDKADQLFKIGTVNEALKSDLFGGRVVYSPKLKPITIFNNKAYIWRWNPLEVIGSSKLLEILGVVKLLTEMERRNLIGKKWLSFSSSPTTL
jgi:hypothetical protein